MYSFGSDHKIHDILEEIIPYMVTLMDLFVPRFLYNIWSYSQSIKGQAENRLMMTNIPEIGPLYKSWRSL